ncbi:hypothetical protein [Photobacterium nomapromontoriensis]|uniref:hypothetical protein n=1 Tax=Photobacterium nomapromontoriensis TaxID=2910237 RepID=UPI003D0FF46B
MNSVDLDGIKRDISCKVTDIFESFEDDNNRMPTLEEFRTIFNSHIDHYIGPMDLLKVEGSIQHTDKFRDRELKLWRAVNELEAEQRFLRSES